MINEFCDKVVVINLDSRVDRMTAMDCQLKEFGIEYERFPAIKDENGIKGLCLTMHKLFSEALKTRVLNLCVLEDDCKFLLPPIPFLEFVLPQLPKDYLCFHLGLNLLTKPTLISQNILRIESSYSTHTIIYSRKAMEMILPLLEREEVVPYDILLMKEIQIYSKNYCCYPMLANQKEGWSDIENKIIDWGKLMSMTFNMHTKNLNNNFMAIETTPCNRGHLINGIAPVVDPKILNTQNVGLIGKVCDCRRFIYDERKCSCPGTPEWQIDWKENTNA